MCTLIHVKFVYREEKVPSWYYGGKIIVRHMNVCFLFFFCAQKLCLSLISF